MSNQENIKEPIRPDMGLFSAISDEMRLKILLLLDQAEFTVNEIKDILDIHQSNASRHLAKLSACNLLKDRRDGIKAYYGLSDDLYLSRRVLSVIRDACEALPDKDIIKCRAAQILEDRTDKTKGQIHKLDQAGGSLKAQISLFAKLMYPFENVVDIGCGEGGDLTLMMAGRCKHVTSIDCDPKVISGLQTTLAQKGITNVSPKVAEMTQTGLRCSSVTSAKATRNISISLSGLSAHRTTRGSMVSRNSEFSPMLPSVSISATTLRPLAKNIKKSSHHSRQRCRRSRTTRTTTTPSA